MPPRPPAVARVLERVTSTVREHGMLLPGQTVLVAVSGGPDSVCLLESLHRLRRLFRVHLEVGHVDHRLRADSGDDARYVARLATRLRLPCHVAVTDSEPAPGDSIEAWARNVRRGELGRLCREVGAARIATAHTLDDAGQTLLMRALSGSGLDGLAGLRPVFGPWVRPLIDVRREDVEAFCRALHLRPRRDPMNEDRRFLRNAIRLDAIPELERLLGRGVREPLARTAALLRDDAEELRRQAGQVFFEVFEETPGGGDLDAVALLGLSPAVAGRVVEQAVIQLVHREPVRTDIDAVLDLARGRPGRRRDLSGGLKAARDREYVHLSRASPESPVRRRGSHEHQGRAERADT